MSSFDICVTSRLPHLNISQKSESKNWLIRMSLTGWRDSLRTVCSLGSKYAFNNCATQHIVESHLLDNSSVLWVGLHAGGKHAVVKKMDWGRACEGQCSDVRPIFSDTN